MSSNAKAYTGLGVLDVLGIVFVVLKLIHVIAWSWWWVTAPFWSPFALVVGVVLIGTLFYLVALAGKTLGRKARRAS